MQTFDASSLIHAWDNYPLEQFPPLWAWLGEQIVAEEFTVPEVAFKEVTDKTPECGDWLTETGIKRLPMSAAIAQEALRIKEFLGIENDNYHAKGVGENDLFIIATASVEGVGLISNEARQARAPDIEAKRKIPSVCGMPEVHVTCRSFIEVIRASGAVFGR